MKHVDHFADFEEARSYLIGIAYRILSSVSDAEDAVQDTYLKWVSADCTQIRSSRAWLTTVCTRRCIDMLRASQRSRVDYIGSWLPEPICASLEENPDAQAELSSSLTTAFLLVLERLSPKERAVYLLREIFDVSYEDISKLLNISNSACRKLVSRAKVHVGKHSSKYIPPKRTQKRLLSAFQNVIKGGDIAELSTLLSQDIKLNADGGGKVPALLKPLLGIEPVCLFLSKKLPDYWVDYTLEQKHLNGMLGIIVRKNSDIVAAVTFGFDASGLVSGIFIVRNPDKLKNIPLTAAKILIS